MGPIIMKTDNFTSFLGWIVVLVCILASIGAGVSLYAMYLVVRYLIGV